MTDAKPNCIAHYVDGATGAYLYSIPYCWPPEAGPIPAGEKLLPGMRYRTEEEYEKRDD